MANPEHLEILKQGFKAWNAWRNQHKDIRPDLVQADLRGADLIMTDLRGATLTGADLHGATLVGANLGEAILVGANLHNADLHGGADLREANLGEATLTVADLRGAILVGANLRNADLRGATLSLASLFYTDLTGADVSQAYLALTVFGNTNLTAVRGLETCHYGGPSVIDHHTLAKSGPLPLAFLRGCGLPDALIEYLPSLLGKTDQFSSCFISYSSADEPFCRRLHERLQDAGLRVWFAPHDMQGGQKLHEQIVQAIEASDKLLLVLSANSIQSPWVEFEIRRARKREVAEQQRRLFPVRLVDYEAIKRWECFDADTAKDLATEIWEYFIPDFTAWEAPDAFEAAVDRLLRDLKAEGRQPDASA